MKTKPILFSGSMVKAILDGRKTMTRRVAKRNCAGRVELDGKNWHLDDPNATLACPYGQPGDLLYVRETWADVNTAEGPALIYRADKEVITWDDFCVEKGEDFGAGPSMNYDKYPGDYDMWWEDLLSGDPGHGWKPSIHMPRWASRLTLKVTGIRVERLQDISEEDAIAEGIDEEGEIFNLSQNILDNIGVVPGASHDIPKSSPAIAEFKHLWDSINGKPRKDGTDISWAANPWVWVVEFEPIMDNVDSIIEN